MIILSAHQHLTLRYISLDSIYIYGGYDGHSVLNDFFEFKLASPSPFLPPATLIKDLRDMMANESLWDVTFLVN